MRGVSSRGQHRQEKDSFNAGRRAKKAVRSRQLRLPVPRRRETIGKTRCRLSFFFFFILSIPIHNIPSLIGGYRILSFVTIPSARRHFLRIDISFSRSS